MGYTIKVVRDGSEQLYSTAYIQVTRRPGQYRLRDGAEHYEFDERVTPGAIVEMSPARYEALKERFDPTDDVGGIILECLPSGPTVRLPEDGDVVYVMSDKTGATVDTYRWPPKQTKLPADALAKEATR